MSIPIIRFNETDYVDAKKIKDYYPEECRGYKNPTQIIRHKKFEGAIFAIIGDDGSVRQTQKRSNRYGTILVPHSELSKLTSRAQPHRQIAVAQSDEYPPLPPIIVDDDLVFKDESGTEYDVIMRGERHPDKIFFSAKCLAVVFDMPQLVKHVALAETSRYEQKRDYIWFRKDAIGVHSIALDGPIETSDRALYLTHDGLLRVIHASRTGVADQFRSWLKDIVFAAWFGTTEQRVQVSAKILNVDAEHLAAIMGKCANPIACIYLIDIKRESDGRHVYKYGRTNNVRRRFREHMTTYGADIELVKFGLIPVSSCVQAENDLRNFVKDFAYKGNEELADKVELIQLNDEELELTGAEILRIANAFGGDMRDQLSLYEKQVVDLNHKHQLEIKDLKHKLELAEAHYRSELENQNLKHQLEMKDKDIKLAEACHQSELKDKDIALLRMQLELAQLKATQH